MQGFWDLPPKNSGQSDDQFVLFPDAEEEIEEEVEKVTDENSNVAGSKGVDTETDDNGSLLSMSNDCDVGRRFLDTHAMSSSPTANYYKPTDEPEPWDLTQLNIEASVMCLVSKVKFLCGRCGSPAIRLRYFPPHSM